MVPAHLLPRARGLDLRQIAIRRQRQHPSHVAERGQRGHKVDAPVTAIGVQGPDLVGGQRRAPARNVRIELKVEHVLHVDLELVDLQGGQPVHQHLQRGQGGDLAARHVVVKPADGKGRPVLDFRRRPAAPAGAGDLQESPDALQQAGGRSSDHVHVSGLDGQPVRLRLGARPSAALVDAKGDRALPGCARKTRLGRAGEDGQRGFQFTEGQAFGRFQGRGNGGHPAFRKLKVSLTLHDPLRPRQQPVLHPCHDVLAF